MYGRRQTRHLLYKTQCLGISQFHDVIQTCIYSFYHSSKTEHSTVCRGDTSLILVLNWGFSTD